MFKSILGALVLLFVSTAPAYAHDWTVYQGNDWMSPKGTNDQYVTVTDKECDSHRVELVFLNGNYQEINMSFLPWDVDGCSGSGFSYQVPTNAARVKLCEYNDESNLYYCTSSHAI